jgi:hypothetical protein
METIDLVSAIVSIVVVGGLTLRCGLMANATLIAEVLWSRRASARALAAANEQRTIAVNPAMAQR